MNRALGGGQCVVRLELVQTLAERLQVWIVPAGQEATGLLDLSGPFGKSRNK